MVLCKDFLVQYTVCKSRTNSFCYLRDGAHKLAFFPGHFIESRGVVPMPKRPFFAVMCPAVIYVDDNWS